MTYRSDLLNPKAFSFVDELTRIKNTNSYFRFFEIFRDRPITLSDLQALYDEREQLYRLTKELTDEVTRFYDAARNLAVQNHELEKELNAVKKSVEWNP